MGAEYYFYIFNAAVTEPNREILQIHYKFSLDKSCLMRARTRECWINETKVNKNALNEVASTKQRESIEEELKFP